MTTPATAVHVSRLPLFAATTPAFALVLALGITSPAAAFVDDDVAGQSTQDNGFEATGEGFVDPDTANSEVTPTAPTTQSAPTGGVAAGFGGMAADQAGLGAIHAVAAGLHALVMLGLAAYRRRVPAGSL
ncbi:MAG TPA: hypothetical protein VM287_15835 [Egibacteraceae bacterium]|nr:hypothetical protein [Egibacteraceae bacterium]